MRNIIVLALAIVGLSGCALPAIPLLAAGSGVGLLDVTAAHGCIGVEMANWMPWNEAYQCKPVSQQ